MYIYYDLSKISTGLTRSDSMSIMGRNQNRSSRSSVYIHCPLRIYTLPSRTPLQKHPDTGPTLGRATSWSFPWATAGQRLGAPGLGNGGMRPAIASVNGC